MTHFSNADGYHYLLLSINPSSHVSKLCAIGELLSAECILPKADFGAHTLLHHYFGNLFHEHGLDVLNQNEQDLLVRSASRVLSVMPACRLLLAARLPLRVCLG
jgi:hypothetical protein